MAFHTHMRWDRAERRPTEDSLNARLIEPEQCTYHRALWDGTCLQVTQTWRTLAAQDRFMREVMTPAMTEAGVTGDPQVVIFAVSDLFLPRATVDVPIPRAHSEHTGASRVTVP